MSRTAIWSASRAKGVTAGTEASSMTISAVGRSRAGEFLLRGAERAGLPKIVRHHADRHRDDEDDNAGREGREIGDRRPGTEADQTPADAEQGGAAEKRRVDRDRGRPAALRLEHRRVWANERKADAGDGKPRGHDHHEG